MDSFSTAQQPTKIFTLPGIADQVATTTAGTLFVWAVIALAIILFLWYFFTHRKK